MYCHQNFQIKHSQSRSSHLHLLLKKNIQYGTIIWIESVRTKMKKVLSKYRKTISFVSQRGNTYGSIIQWIMETIN